MHLVSSRVGTLSASKENKQTNFIVDFYPDLTLSKDILRRFYPDLTLNKPTTARVDQDKAKKVLKM